MTHRDFDKALASLEPAPENGTPFTIGGREWHLGTLPDRLVLQWITASNGSSDSMAMKRAVLIEQFLSVLVVAAERDDWDDFTLHGRTVTEVVEKKVGTGKNARVEETVVERFFPPPGQSEFIELVLFAIEDRSANRPTKR